MSDFVSGAAIGIVACPPPPDPGAEKAPAPTIDQPAATCTSNGTITLTGTYAAGTQVEVREGVNSLGLASPGTTPGTWTLAVPATSGTHTYTAVAHQTGKNDSDSVSVTVEVGAPCVVPDTGGPGGTGGDGSGTGNNTGTPQQEIAGDIAGCVSKAFTLHVAKKGIRRIVFRVDGKKVKSARAKAVKGKSFTLRINPVNHSFGKTHRVKARLVLKNGKRRTVRMRSFTRCNLGKCVSRRSFRIHVKTIRGERVRSAVVRVNGKKVKTVRGKRLSAPVNLVGLPKGKVTVKIVMRTASGRTVTDTRYYRTCVPKKTS